ncbi:hypothetical protein JF544_02275 [Halobacillus kuroshimensis]|uniref:Uncharacterized protein n=1 Tax=Halobacillus kuroshimensis TaxID=302481 RepID=A0ABS3DRT6_9BACI|nr:MULTISPECIES: hypothetical protein [Halobacillus]MBN8234049.1 hypothetical protein [Halobacillus kuroshimensis]
MEKLIEQNNDEIIIKYMVVSVFSLLTLRKFKKVEKIRKDLKKQQKLNRDSHRI